MQQVNTRQVKIFARKLHIRTICDAEGFASRGYLSPAPPRAPVRCSRLRWGGSELLAVSFILHDQMIRCGQNQLPKELPRCNSCCFQRAELTP